MQKIFNRFHVKFASKHVDYLYYCKLDFYNIILEEIINSCRGYTDFFFSKYRIFVLMVELAST